MKSLTIVGCGNLGSSMARCIVERSWSVKELTTLYLVDNDIVETKNLPYLFFGKENIGIHLENPKVICLCNQLESISPLHLNIVGMHDCWENVSQQIPEDSYIIDCMDLSLESDKFNLRLRNDGKFGRIIKNPTNKMNSSRQTQTNYLMGNSPFYASLFSYIVCERIIFGEDTRAKNVREECVVMMDGFVEFYDIE